MTKFTMFKIIQIVNIWDIISTYTFYNLAWNSFRELSPFYELMWWNIYAFLFLKYILLVILSIWVFKLFSYKYFVTFYLIVYSLYSYAIINNVMAYHTLSNIMMIENLPK